MFHLYREDVGSLVRMTRDHFAKINQDITLTDEDKRRLKEFYLQNFIASRAHKLLQEFSRHEFSIPPTRPN